MADQSLSELLSLCDAIKQKSKVAVDIEACFAGGTSNQVIAMVGAHMWPRLWPAEVQSQTPLVLLLRGVVGLLCDLRERGGITLSAGTLMESLTLDALQRLLGTSVDRATAQPLREYLRWLEGFGRRPMDDGPGMSPFAYVEHGYNTHQIASALLSLEAPSDASCVA